MTPARKKRLKTIGLIFFAFASAVGLTVYALQSDLNHYYSLEQVAAQQAPLEQAGIRIGGMVEKGSLRRLSDGLAVEFKITDFRSPSVTVHYQGILPDLFREGQGIIATGILTSATTFKADVILAKHDETYMPKELVEDLERAGYQHSSQKSSYDK